MCRVTSSVVVISVYGIGYRFYQKNSRPLDLTDSLDYLVTLHFLSQYMLAVQRMSLQKILQILHMQELAVCKVCMSKYIN